MVRPIIKRSPRKQGVQRGAPYPRLLRSTALPTVNLLLLPRYLLTEGVCLRCKAAG